MKNAKLALVLVVAGIVATGCCCPLSLLPLCLPSTPQGALQERGGPDDVQAPIAAVAPVAQQRF